MRGWDGGAAARCPLRSLLASTGAWTPGFEAGSAGRRGPECDPIVANNAAPGHSGRRVETEARVGDGQGGARAGAWSILGDIVRPGRAGGRVRMLRSAERPAERGGEGGGPSTGKVRAGTGAAAQRDRERRTGAWVPPVAGPSAVARGSSITARCHGDRIWSPRPQLPWRHPDLPRLPKAEGARPGFW